MKKVWFITGASKGFGLELVRQLLAKNENVAATSRNKKELAELVGEHNNFLPLQVTLNDESDVKKAIDATIEKFGSLDVIINNAGYGLFGSIEELSDAEARQNFEVNVFGSLNVIRQGLPQMRKQRSGHIFNISSIGGYLGDFPGFGIYCATKFAVVGFTESLAMEVRDFNIKATAVMPGYFRTSFLTSGSIATPTNEIADYQSTRDSQDFHLNQMNMNQNGDPVKGAKAIIDTVYAENAPVHLFLGSDAYKLAKDKAKSVIDELESWKGVTVSTDF
ncbi:SDR family NAD(P)-dependent oxidoreductase [Flavobacterium sp. MAH-1]|uniref:SDR family NAD(P)-dependent oxidoreductase n=1 Tax=Flavobacterium agri TaxID=2743471 RepID=A0A7Y8Y5A1_9FLAO|nr:SDR family NAD(P)-dependent oxidoreductase [Flavobacterium agri]NUY82644.1 SDR family NAD(P)-dependent oxidoreductase [Flavobacterium agri]NYA72667.1 SDR family NAD(P)-dependent oxidoreductase [Flavobacterium agri]